MIHGPSTPHKHVQTITSRPDIRDNRTEIYSNIRIRYYVSHSHHHPSHYTPYKNTPINATTAAPPDTPLTTLPPVNAGAVGVELAPALLTALPAALVALGTYLLWVAATLATLAADADAAGLRGLAALQYEVTVFSTGGFSSELGQLL
jgi:hypothetical protein